MLTRAAVAGHALARATAVGFFSPVPPPSALRSLAPPPAAMRSPPPAAASPRLAGSPAPLPPTPGLVSAAIPARRCQPGGFA